MPSCLDGLAKLLLGRERRGSSPPGSSSPRPADDTPLCIHSAMLARRPPPTAPPPAAPFAQPTRGGDRSGHGERHPTPLLSPRVVEAKTHLRRKSCDGGRGATCHAVDVSNADNDDISASALVFSNIAPRIRSSGSGVSPRHLGIVPTTPHGTPLCAPRRSFPIPAAPPSSSALLSLALASPPLADALIARATEEAMRAEESALLLRPVVAPPQPLSPAPTPLLNSTFAAERTTAVIATAVTGFAAGQPPRPSAVAAQSLQFPQRGQSSSPSLAPSSSPGSALRSPGDEADAAGKRSSSAARWRAPSAAHLAVPFPMPVPDSADRLTRPLPTSSFTRFPPLPCNICPPPSHLLAGPPTPTEPARPPFRRSIS